MVAEAAKVAKVVAMAEDNFLGRWSRRKLDVREGKPLPPEPPAPAPPVVTGRAVGPGAVDASLAGDQTEADRAAAPSAPVEPPPALAPAPTLEDAQALTSQSDFTPYGARDVAPEVRNVAMKKLFSDPHFNVMDRMDIYIDDYSRPDPIPPELLRSLTSARFLDLFDDVKNEKERAAKGRDVADDLCGESVAQSEPAVTPDGAAAPHDETETTSQPPPDLAGGGSQDEHAHADLRLQPDDAAPGKDPGGNA